MSCALVRRSLKRDFDPFTLTRVARSRDPDPTAPNAFPFPEAQGWAGRGLGEGRQVMGPLERVFQDLGWPQQVVFVAKEPEASGVVCR